MKEIIWKNQAQMGGNYQNGTSRRGMGRHGLHSPGSVQGQVPGTCERGNEPSGSTKCGEFLDQLTTGQLLRKDSAPWIYICKLASLVRRYAKNIKDSNISLPPHRQCLWNSSEPECLSLGVVSLGHCNNQLQRVLTLRIRGATHPIIRCRIFCLPGCQPKI